MPRLPTIRRTRKTHDAYARALDALLRTARGATVIFEPRDRESRIREAVADPLLSFLLPIRR